MSARDERPFDEEYLVLLGEAVGLTPEECLDFRERVRRGDPEALAEVRDYEAGVESFADESVREIAKSEIAPPVLRMPPPELERVRSLHLLESTEPWTPTGIPGIEVRELAKDSDRGQVCRLVKIDAGGLFPPHDHPGGEEILILEGDLWSEGVELVAGDTQIHGVGSHHQEAKSRGGCIALITSGI